jgi:uncharacterized protein YuzE
MKTFPFALFSLREKRFAPSTINFQLTTASHMKISYDPEVDALSITFRETTVTTKHLAEGIAADYASEGRLAGLEILDAQKRFGGTETMRRVELEAIGT